MKLLPFDLQRALAGDKVVTRNGREVTQLTRFDCKSSFTLAGVINDAVYMWQENGMFTSIKTDFDLFMAPKTVKRWVNFYGSASCCYETEKEAKSRGINSVGAIAIAVPVEFEEGYGCE